MVRDNSINKIKTKQNKSIKKTKQKQMDENKLKLNVRIRHFITTLEIANKKKQNEYVEITIEYINKI